MKVQRTLALLMAAALAAGAFAGCGPGGTTASKTPGSDNKTYADTMTLTWMIPTQQTQAVYSSKIVEELMKKFNVDIEFEELPSGSSYQQKKSLYLGTQDLPDIMTWVTAQEANQYGPMGAFIDLNQYKDKIPNLTARLNADGAKAGYYNAYNLDGQLFRFPDYYMDEDSNFTFSYSKPDVDALGTVDMSTWDGVYDVLKRLKEKHPGSTPLAMRGAELGGNSVKSLFIQSFTEGMVNPAGLMMPAYDPAQDKYVPAITVSGFKEAVEFFTKLYNEKLMAPNYLTMRGMDVEAGLKDGNVFMTEDFNAGHAEYEPVQSVIGNKLVPMSLPQAPGKKQVYGIQTLKIGDRGTVLSGALVKDQAKLERAAAMIDWLYSDEAYELLYYHPDVTASNDKGQKYYTDDSIYSHTGESIDLYLPWSMTASFLVNYFSIVKPDGPYDKLRQATVQNPDCADKYAKNFAIPFTNDEYAKINELRGTVEDYFTLNSDKFVRGQKSMDEWGSFVETVLSKGGKELAEMYDKNYQQHVKGKQ